MITGHFDAKKAAVPLSSITRLNPCKTAVGFVFVPNNKLPTFPLRTVCCHRQ